jgi:hypothetical protein
LPPCDSRNLLGGRQFPLLQKWRFSRKNSRSSGNPVLVCVRAAEDGPDPTAMQDALLDARRKKPGGEPGNLIPVLGWISCQEKVPGLVAADEDAKTATSN